MELEEVQKLRALITVQACKAYLNRFDTHDGKEWSKWVKGHKEAIKGSPLLKDMEHEAAYYSSLMADAFIRIFEKKKIKNEFVIKTSIEIMPEVYHVYIQPSDSILLKNGISWYDDLARSCVKYAEALALILGINSKL